MKQPSRETGDNLTYSMAESAKPCKCAARKALEDLYPYLQSVSQASTAWDALAASCECAGLRELRADLAQSDADQQDKSAEIIRLRAELAEARQWLVEASHERDRQRARADAAVQRERAAVEALRPFHNFHCANYVGDGIDESLDGWLVVRGNGKDITMGDFRNLAAIVTDFDRRRTAP
jgi:hypothetical protein